MSDYAITFKEGSPIWNLYQRLKKDGVSDEQIDQGYMKTDYVKKERGVVGRGDHKIKEEEVLDYALERYERYQLAIKETTGYIVPWSLDDLDPKTTFDEETRTRINKAISFFQEELKKAGYQEGTDKYQELLALSLYAFALFPADGKFPENLRLHAEKLGLGEALYYFEAQGKILELENAGLKGMFSYLKDHGGLGIMEMRADCELEATALEALQKGCGGCTERSSILYPLFKMAGLKAKFVYGIPMETGALHASLGLILDKKMRFYDSALKTSNAESFYKENFDWWFEQTNREFLGGYYSNLGVAYADKGELDKAIAAYKKAIEINPNYAEAHYNLGLVYADKGEPDKAIAAYKKAIELNPNYAKAHGNLGFIFAKKGDLNQAVRSFTQSFKLPPVASLNVTISMLINRLKEKWQSNDALKKTAAVFYEEMGGRIEIAEIEAFFVISASLWLAGKHEQARERLEIIVSALDFKKKPSQSTREFFKKMIGLLPEEMKTDTETRILLKALKEKLSPPSA